VSPTAAVLAALPWLLAAAVVPFLMARRPRLLRRAAPGDAVPPVAVIVPARNEAANIGPCVSGLLGSDYPVLEIIVVDDGSTDGTAEIAGLLAERGEGRVRLVEAEPLPAGWRGRAWACWQGYRATNAPLLLFTAAGNRHDDDLLDYAVAALHDARADLLSLRPRQRLDGFWDRVVAPQFLLLETARLAPRAFRARHAVAHTQALLIRRAAYDRLDGHRAVRGELADDRALARLAANSELRVMHADAGPLLETRLRRPLRTVLRDWTRLLAAEPSRGSRTRRRRLRAIGLAALLIGFWVVPPAALLAGAFGANVSMTWAAVASLACLALWGAACLRLGVPLAHAASFPIAASLAAIALLRGAATRRIQWRGRSYDLQRTR